MIGGLLIRRSIYMCTNYENINIFLRKNHLFIDFSRESEKNLVSCVICQIIIELLEKLLKYSVLCRLQCICLLFG